MKTGTILCSLLLVLAACAYADTEADHKQSLMDADKALFESLHDREAFQAHLAPDVYLLAPDQPRVQGTENFGAWSEATLQLPGAQLTWSADLAEVSAGGDMGYTIGAFQLTLDGPDGNPVTRTGKYVTLWKRQAEGPWKVVADAFNFDAPAPE